ncbi:metallophosphoesterase family protein [Phreatobacter sp. AB_2022a]|uniref:metallophosphoesterase family protein n=1 Tax=Phreatobacter sp. AB_2022a TaxID=3003134 RepID=UPI002286DAD3|nr:DNA repair exonuclease [Phreatobacter sp. AB_2022a]MCZ0737156.1 DNA repair exonuclease [Phreatobacter sp. AB_2022a]
MFRFIHTADVHLDSPLRSLALRDPDLAELIGNATRRAFVRTIDLCLEEQVDALLIAGDLYDGDQTSMKTARFLADQLHRLDAAGIRSFIIRGNHDAVSRITRELVFPDSVKVFGARAEMVVLDRAAGRRPVAVHGLSFAQPHAPESLVGRYRPAVDGAINIGLLHTSLGGAPGHDRYAPCSLADLQATGFDYWALGHVHRRAVAEAGGAVVMPGMPQGRDINEAGAKSVTLVAIDDNRSVHIEERPTSIAQFERVVVDVTGLDDWRDLVGAITRRLDQERQAARSEQLVTRLTLAGTTPLAWRIRRDIDLLKTEADQRAAAVGACWVEKLDAACEPPARTAQSSADPLAELHRLMTDEILASDSFQAELAAMAEELRAQLPAECRDVLGLDEAAFRNTLARLAGEGAESVVARLEAADGNA